MIARFKARWTRFIRTRRRFLAAVCAALATACALLALTSSPAPEQRQTSTDLRIPPDRVALPIAVRFGADLLGAGDLVDLVGTDSEGSANVLAREAMILQASNSSGFGTSAATVLVAVTRAEAVVLATRPPEERVSVLILPG